MSLWLKMWRYFDLLIGRNYLANILSDLVFVWPFCFLQTACREKLFIAKRIVGKQQVCIFRAVLMLGNFDFFTFALICCAIS